MIMQEKILESQPKIPSRKKFSKIGILANKSYAIALNQLKSKNVLVFAENDVTFGELKNIIKLKDKQIKENILWLAFTGIHSIADSCHFKLCHSSRCQQPINALELEKDYYDYKTMDIIISNLINNIISLQKEVKSSCLSDGSDFQMMPPLPISVLTNKILTHDEIHSKLSENDNCFVVVDRSHLTILSDVYINFCSQVWHALYTAGRLDHPAYCFFLSFYKNLDYVSTIKMSDDFCSMNLYKDNVQQLIINSIENITPQNQSTKSGLSSYLQPSLNKRYDQIMFIGNEVILNHLSAAFPSKCSIFNAKFPLNWFEICDGVTVYKTKYKKILFIIVADLTIITREELNKDCISHCNTKVSYLSLESDAVEFYIKNNIQSIQDVKAKLEAYFQDKDCVIVAPLFPRFCIKKPYNNSFHELMHKIALHSCNPLFLEGQLAKWDYAISIMTDLWYKQFASLAPPGSIFDEKGSDMYKATPLSWEVCNGPGVMYSLNEKPVLLEKWETNLGKIVIFYSKMLHEGNEAGGNMGRANSNPNTYAAISTSNASITRNKHQDDDMNVTSNLSQYEVNEGTTKGYIIGGSNFINVLSNLRNIENANFVKKKLTGLPKVNIPSLVSELGITNKLNVCFFLFDLSYFTREVELRQCTTFKCKEKHVAFMPTLNDMGPGASRNIEQSIEEIDTFLKMVNEYAIALPLPVPPSQLYCNMSKICSSHANLEWIYKQAHFALGKKLKWKAYLNILEKQWTSFICRYYSKFTNATEILMSYLSGSIDIFKLYLSVDEFTGDVSAYEKWINVVTNLVLTITNEDLNEQVNYSAGGNLSTTAQFGIQDDKMSNNYQQDEPSSANTQLNVGENSSTHYTLGQTQMSAMKMPNQEQQQMMTMQPNIINPFQNTSPNQMNIPQLLTNVTAHANNLPQMQPAHNQFDNNIQTNPTSFANSFQQITGQSNTPMQFMSEFQQMHQSFAQNQLQMGLNVLPTLQNQEAPLSFMNQNMNQRQDYLGQHTVMNAIHNQSATINNLISSLAANISVKSNNSQFQSNLSHNIAPIDSSAREKTNMDMIPKPLMPFDGSDVTVLITGFSANLPVEFLLDLLSYVSKQAKVLEQKTGYLKVVLPTSDAHLVVNRLDEARIGDSYIQAKYCDYPDLKIDPPVNQVSHMQRIYRKTYQKWCPAISAAMEKQLLDGLDISTFKTRFCLLGCDNSDACKDYHWAGDKRRNPLVQGYNTDMCDRIMRNEEGLLSGQGCYNGQTCKYSHNLYEQMFHPNNFQTVLCRSSATGEECSKYPFCKFAHIDTPEMFFTKHWTDLIVFGLENSFTYIVGALKACTKLPENKSNLIYVVSSSVQFLRLLKMALKDIAKTYNMSVCLLEANEIPDTSANIFLGKPTHYITSRLMSYSNKMVAPSALIVEDVEAIFKNDVEAEYLNSLYHRLKRFAHSFASLQKVFVVAKYNEKTSGTISRFFGIQLKTVNKIYLKSTRKKEAAGGTTVSKKKFTTLDKAQVLAGKPPEEKQSYKPYFVQRKTEPYNQSANVHGRQEELNNKPPYDRKSPQSEKKFNFQLRNAKFLEGKGIGSQRKSKFSRVASVHQGVFVKSDFVEKESSHYDNNPTSKRKFPNESENDGNTRRTSRWAPEQKSFHTEESKHKMRMQLQESASQKNSELMKDYLEAKVKLLHEHEEETRVLKELPEIYPNYETVYGNFLSYYRKQFGERRDENHLNANWVDYWVKYLNSVKNDDLEKKITILKDTLGVKEEEQKKEYSSTSVQKEIPEDVFTVAKTLDILEEFKEKFGILGHSLQEMVNFARKYSPESDGALEVFADPEHAQLCKLIIQKMIVLRNASKYTGPIYDMAIQWTTELLNKAAEYKKNNTQLNVQAIARATLGKGSSFTLDIIKRRLSREGNKQPPKELVNKLYLDVCSAHFNITMGQD